MPLSSHIGLALTILALAMTGQAAIADQAALAEVGKQHFLRCAACHATSAQEEARFGPHLEGIGGRPAAAVEGYAYSDTVRALTFLWDEAHLDQWLERPQEMVPGMCMPYFGLPDPEACRALVSYLRNPEP